MLGIVDSGWCRIAFRDATVKVTAGQGFVIAPETAHRVVLDGMADHRALSVPPPAGKACPRSGLIVHPRWAVAFGAAFDELPADGRRACRDLVALAGATLGYIGAHGPEPRAVRSVRKRLAATDVARPTLEQLAATAGLSPWHLQRLYLRQTGLSPHDADQAIRLRQARTLVLAGMPLAVAAAVAGFSDQSHFNRVFKRLMWLPPGRWAAQVQRSRSSIG